MRARERGGRVPSDAGHRTAPGERPARDAYQVLEMLKRNSRPKRSQLDTKNLS